MAIPKQIVIREETKNKLKQMQVHPRETYGDVIDRLISFYEQKNLDSKDKD